MKQPVKHPLHVKRMGINTYKEAIVYIRADSYICRSEGFEAQARIRVSVNDHFIIATLNIITNDSLLEKDEVGLSEQAWQLLNVRKNDKVYLSHPKPLKSLKYIHDKIYNRPLSADSMNTIMKDVVAGRLSDIYIASFLTACAAGRLDQNEIIYLIEAMNQDSLRITWPAKLVLDKHCIGGIPGNRTTLIVIPIVAAFGLFIPKTSSRAITSAAGTLDTMEVLAPVELSLNEMHKVVEQENGCVVWGKSVSSSPADDILIRVEHALNLNSEGQMIASILSKKMAAGSNHIVIDAPRGAAAKIRNDQEAQSLKKHLEAVAKHFDMEAKIVFTDGSQPVGRGIGPALEARDVIAVLQNKKEAPQDLRDRALMLAGELLEFSPNVKKGQGKKIAEEILVAGQAWKKFQAICDAQGGMRSIPKAKYHFTYEAETSGKIITINNHRMTRLAKLAGAPKVKAAGVDLYVKVGDAIQKGQPLFTIQADTKGELDYAIALLKTDEIIGIK